MLGGELMAVHFDECLRQKAAGYFTAGRFTPSVSSKSQALYFAQHHH